MVTDKLNEIYRNVENPLAELRQSDLYQLWEAQNRNSAAGSQQDHSLSGNIRQWILGLDSLSFIAFIIGIGLLVIGFILLAIARRKERREKQEAIQASETVVGVITTVSMRTEGRKERRYGLVEFDYHGFRYTQGFFLPKQPEYEPGKQVSILVNPNDIRLSRIVTPFSFEISPVRNTAMWFVVIGITILLCLLL